MTTDPISAIDWTQAPPEADAWEMTEFGYAIWTQDVPTDCTTIDSTEPAIVMSRVVVGRHFAPRFGLGPGAPRVTRP